MAACTCPDVYVSRPEDFELMPHRDDCPQWLMALATSAETAKRTGPLPRLVSSDDVETSVERLLPLAAGAK